MIYDLVEANAPVQQGDIFRDIPRIDFSLHQMSIVDVDDYYTRVLSWRDLLEEQPEAINVVLPIKRVRAIVITQNCDAARGEFLSLCQIKIYLPAIGQKQEPKVPLKWAKLISRKSRENLRYFYLPADEGIGLNDRMVVDFRMVLAVKRPELQNMKDLRIGRLNNVAYEHFRETLAQFFRRYPYNEWYPFTKEEFRAYADTCPEPVEPYPWQE